MEENENQMAIVTTTKKKNVGKFVTGLNQMKWKLLKEEEKKDDISSAALYL